MKTSPSTLRLLLIFLAVVVPAPFFLTGAEQAMHKESSAFFPPELMEKAKSNIKKYPWAAQMRNFQGDLNPQIPSSVDWKIEDRYNLLPEGADIHLRYTDLTNDAEAFTAEGWISTGGYNESSEAWIPRIMVRRSSDKKPLASAFVSVIEPYERSSAIAQIRRLPLESSDGKLFPDSNVAIEITLKDGRCDLFITADVENPRGLVPSLRLNETLAQKDWGLRCDAEMCLVRRDLDGTVRWIMLCKGRTLSIKDKILRLKKASDFFEVSFNRGQFSVVSGRAENIDEITFK